jgi:hypothetical protein
MADQSATLAQISQLLQSLAQNPASAGGQPSGSSGVQSLGSASASTQGSSGAHDGYTPRERLQAMMIRAYIDEDYANSLRANPEAALERVGFSSSEARGIMQQPRGVDALTRGSCMDTTCIVSLCPSSCVASVPAIPGVCTESASSNPITNVLLGGLGSVFGGF